MLVMDENLLFHGLAPRRQDIMYRARLLGHKFRFGFFYAVATWTASDGLPLDPFSTAQVA